MTMGLYQPDVKGYFDLTDRRPPKSEKKPALGDVNLSINTHQSTEGHFRFRVALTKEAFGFIAAGLSDPKIRIEGDVGHGLKICCSDRFGVKPTVTGQKMVCSVPIRSMKGRESFVTSTPVEYEKAYDDNGPVLLIPKLPDIFLPETIRSKLPGRSAKDPTVISEAYNKAERSRQAAENLFKPSLEDLSSSLKPTDTPPEPEPEPVADAPQEIPEPPLVEVVPEPSQPSHGFVDILPDYLLDNPKVERTVEDLRAAIQMVNEMVAEIGQDIVLFTSRDGQTLHARRRLVTYVDL